MYPNIRVLLIIGCTLPVSSAEAERLFSGLRRIKSYLRNRMSARLSGLALMPGAHQQERPYILGGVPSTVADVVIFRTQISPESGFRSSGCCKSLTSFLLRSSAILPNASPFI